MLQARYEQAVSISERTQTNALGCAAIATGTSKNRSTKIVTETFLTANSAVSRTCRKHSEWQIYVGQNIGPLVIRDSL